MKKKVMLGLIAMVAIVAVAIFVGGIEKDQVSTPTATPSPTITPTSMPTPILEENIEEKKEKEGGKMGLGLTESLQIIGVVTAIFALWIGIHEYIRQGSSKRAEQFFLMRSRLRENPKFLRICNLLVFDDLELRKISPIEKDNFLGFFEELTLLWNSRVFNDQIVLYSFGYFAIKCWESKNFWVAGMNRDDKYWAHFRDFVKRVEKLDKEFKPSRGKYKL